MILPPKIMFSREKKLEELELNKLLIKLLIKETFLKQISIQLERVHWERETYNTVKREE